MRASLVTIAFLGLAGCSGNTPSSVASRFVGRYYVEMDHAAALALATGAAAKRVRREMDLLTDARRQGIGPPADRPRVYFERLGEPEARDGGYRLTFKLTIHVATSAPLERHAVIEVLKVDGAWRVADFTESAVR